MNIKKSIPWLMLAALIFVMPLSSCNAFEWRTDLAAAASDAQTGQKLILLNFSGSDWCGWCKRLDAEVFSTSEFKDYAAANLVCVIADFPRGTKLPPALQAQNERLMRAFRVEGFPTILVFNSAAELIGQLGYQPGGPAAFINSLKQVQARAAMRPAGSPAGPKLPLE